MIELLSLASVAWGGRTRKHRSFLRHANDALR